MITYRSGFPPLLRPLALALAAAAVCLASNPASSQPKDLRVVVISDLNSSYGSTDYEPEVHRAIELIRDEWRPDLVFAAGDLIAGQRPSLTDGEVRAMWSAFDAAVAAPLRESGIPFGFTLGNHDASAYPAHERDRRLAVAFWSDPQHHPGVAFVDSSHFPLYYSFRQGDLFGLSWDATYDGTVEDAELMEWVHAQLSSDEARTARYRFVLGHLPLYAVAEGRNRAGEVLQKPDSLRSILERYDVHTYVSGHHHAYYPGRRGRLELLHTAALGQGPRQLIGSVLPPTQAITILDFPADADTVHYTTLAFGDSLEVIETTDLPPIIEGMNGYVVRRDLPDTGAPMPKTTRDGGTGEAGAIDPAADSRAGGATEAGNPGRANAGSRAGGATEAGNRDHADTDVQTASAASDADPPAVSSPRWSAHVGVGSARAWNFVGITMDIVRRGRTSTYLAAGFGTILIGLGAAYHANRDGSGIVLSATAGLAGAHANAGYQIRLADRTFLTGGVSAGSFFLQHNGVLPFLAFERRF